jgi:NAD dependent epimerase/dehydratase
MKRVLVTGAGGFIGSHLTEELVREGFQVRALVKYNSRNDWGNIELLPDEIQKEIEIVAGNIEDPFLCQKITHGVGCIYHLAALIAIPYSYVAPDSYVATNIKGTVNILQAALHNDVQKIVHTSTSETYGTARYTPIDEAHPLQGQSPYSASKIGADKIAESYYLSFGLPVAVLRPFNNYGPRQSARAVIPTIISQALTTTNKKIRLGSLEPVRDLLYVKDTARAFIMVAKSMSTNGEVLNVGFGKGISIGDLAGKILEQIDPEIEIILDKDRIRPEKSEVMKLICDASKAEKMVGWKPVYDLDTGLGETITFMKKNIGNYKPDIYNL